MSNINHTSKDLYQDEQRTRDTNIYLGNPQGEKTQKNLSLIMHDLLKYNSLSKGDSSHSLNLPLWLMNKPSNAYQLDQMKNPSTSLVFTSIQPMLIEVYQCLPHNQDQESFQHIRRGAP